MNYLPVAAPDIGNAERAAVDEAISTGWISSAGPAIDQFESMVAASCGTKHAIAVMNGTVALHLCLLSAGIGPGDEVLVPDLTFAATAEAVLHCGAKPVLVDIERATWGLDPQAIESACTPATKAIVPVHLYGHPADMDAIKESAAGHDLLIVEDAAEAHGARINDRPVGGLADAGIFSYYGNKIITTGEGGAIVTDSDELAERCRLLRNHGQPPGQRYWHQEIGFNHRMTNLQAAIGVAQMFRFDELLADRDRIGALYRDLLESVLVENPPHADWARPVTWLHTILLPHAADRGKVIARLAKDGVDSRPAFHPLHTMPPFADPGAFPVATEIGRRGLSLPTLPRMSEDDVHRVCQTLQKGLPT